MSKMDKLRGAINKNDSASVERAMNSIINNDIREVIINFNYSNLNLDLKDLEELQEHEKALLMQGKSLNRISIKIGEHLHKAREIFIKSHSESFMEWYEAIGLNKNNVRVFMARYKYFLDFPEQKDRILDLSDIVIKETLNKKNPDKLLEKVISGEISTAEQIRKVRVNNSTGVELFTDNIQEAEIVEDYGRIMKKEFEEVMEALSKAENVANYSKNNIDILVKIKKMLNSMK